MDAIRTDFRRADLDAPDRGMLEFAAKLTLTPSAIKASDVETLRNLGFDDAAIHDVVQVTALFSYFNRLADGLGIDLEPDMPPPENRADF